MGETLAARKSAAGSIHTHDCFGRVPCVPDGNEGISTNFSLIIVAIPPAMTKKKELRSFYRDRVQPAFDRVHTD